MVKGRAKAVLQGVAGCAAVVALGYVVPEMVSPHVPYVNLKPRIPEEQRLTPTYKDLRWPYPGDRAEVAEFMEHVREKNAFQNRPTNKPSEQAQKEIEVDIRLREMQEVVKAAMVREGLVTEREATALPDNPYNSNVQ